MPRLDLPAKLTGAAFIQDYKRGGMMLDPLLLVEDDKRDLELTLLAFERCGLINEVVVVSDGAAALQFLNGEGIYASRESRHPAVVVLDLKLPKVNGLEVLKTVRSTDATRSIPVIMLTSSNEVSDLKKSRALGVEAYVVKPSDFKSFVALLAGLDALWSLVQRTEATA